MMETSPSETSHSDEQFELLCDDLERNMKEGCGVCAACKEVYGRLVEELKRMAPEGWIVIALVGKVAIGAAQRAQGIAKDPALCPYARKAREQEQQRE